LDAIGDPKQARLRGREKRQRDTANRYDKKWRGRLEDEKP
jgi:hypothetical protein